MKQILNSNRIYVALFVLSGMFAFAVQPVRAEEEGAGQKGCWYEKGDAPACDICGWDCIDGQQCCGISVE